MKIAVLPGDGIGPEIIKQAVKVLDAFGLTDSIEYAPIGGAGYEEFNDPLPEKTLNLALNADAVLLGAVGDWRFDKLPRDMRPERGLLRIRHALNLFANLRPAIMFPELVHTSSLKPEVVSGLDIMIIRELTGDIYFGQPRGISINENGEQEGINTNSSMGEMFFGIISSINQYQLSQISENVKSGLRLAKKKGRLVGRQSVLDKGKIWEIEKLKDKGFSYRKIAKKMNVSHSTIMRCVNEKHILNKEVSVDG